MLGTIPAHHARPACPRCLAGRPRCPGRSPESRGNSLGLWQRQSPSSPCPGPHRGRRATQHCPGPPASLTQQHGEAHAAQRCRVQHPSGREDGVGTPCERKRGGDTAQPGQGHSRGRRGQALTMGHHDQGVLLGGGALTWAQQNGIEVQAPCGGGVGRSELGEGSGAQSYWGYSPYWGCSCSGGGRSVRMPQLMPGTGGASCRQTHCTCASRPAPGRTATFCTERRVGVSPERG